MTNMAKAAFWAMVPAVFLALGCGPAATGGSGETPLLPCPATRPAADRGGKELTRFVVDSPFAADYTRPEVREGKRLWARSCLYDKAPDLVVEKWLTDRPDTKDKYVLIEFWATWCPPCRRSIALLNAFHHKYRDELAVIGISDETEEAVRALTDHPIEYASAIDTQARMKNELEVVGIPHVVIVEPNGHVVWEGFPFLENYELTEQVVEKILDVGRKLRRDDAKAK